jgi:quinol monooxygenase YgiN
MSVTVLIRHRALPGRRSDLHDVWKQHMQPAVADNPGHEAYYYCFDDADADVVVVYQQYADSEAAAAFLETAAYRAYLEESEPLLAEPPALTRAVPQWQKSA